MKRPSFRFRTPPKQKKSLAGNPTCSSNGRHRRRPEKGPEMRAHAPDPAQFHGFRNHGSPWCPVSPRPRRCNPPRPTTERLLMASRLAFVFARQPAGSFSFGSSVSPRSISPTGSPSALARLYTVVYSVFHRPYSMFVFFLPFFSADYKFRRIRLGQPGFYRVFLVISLIFVGLLGFYWVIPRFIG